MHESPRPSRQFIIRGSAAIGVVALILIVQTNWFRALIHKKPVAKLPPTTTVGDIVMQDTNGNGIADWEEKLWGLDPTVLYTNGVSNKQIIEEKKKALGVTDATTTAPQNETDQLARELFTLTQALGQSGQVDDARLSDIATKLGASINLKSVSNRYSIKDIQTLPTSESSLKNYYNSMTKKVAGYQTSLADIDVIISALETGDTSRVPELLESATAYRKIAKDLASVPVPIGLAQYHLDIVNAFSGVADSFVLLQELDSNATNALVGISVYKTYSAKLGQALIDMRDYFTRYGILSS